ncbi:hypothetical protein [Salmonirosea aquatica]|uniref:T9SS type A sorting domain-containing protein n=1 Tax=Salmonirosea aquatica TaxID=2654236 RepID=A0A7C9BVH9_9BACT|nr:hypothetical protein [Cytophagaceae bacterium SJW1-29]
MKTIIIFALAGALGLAAPDHPCFNSENPSAEISGYVVTDHMAMYLGSDHKLRLRFGRMEGNAVVEVLHGPRTLYRNHIDLRKGAHQNLNLSELENGSYLIRVTVGKQVTDKTLVIRQHTEQSYRLS